MSNIRPFKNITPLLAEGVYVDDSAVVIGDVHIGKNSSVWPLCVIRGDVNHCRIGENCNIQDGTVIHLSRPRVGSPDGYPTILGNNVSIGHKVMLHGCTIGNNVLIGMGAIVLDGAIIEDEVLVGAGALVAPGKCLESGYLYLGTPTKKVRPLKDSERELFTSTAENYVLLKDEY
ncbi:MAG: carbonic anhydrase/acetyltransferase-like protein (isoleucine patch superfamily) [Pseudohongiellaceae bacterium]|jgi:carbonic anhydrase/acetyltransferase-like protein (isoleucine patch superfamily)